MRLIESIRCALMVCTALSIIALDEPCQAQQSEPPADYQRMLELFELTSQESESITDGSGIPADERPVLSRCLECVSRIPAHLAVKWQEYGLDYGVMLAAIAQHRFQLISLHGRLRGLERVEGDWGPATSTELYKVVLELAPTAGESAVVAELLVHRIPQPWVELVGQKQNWDERVSATGMVFKRLGARRLFLVARRLAWHPDAASDEPFVDQHHVWLAQHGMDIGALYDVSDVGKLAAHDAPAFYGALAAMKRASTKDIEIAAPVEANVVDLLQHLPTHRGKLYKLTGHARRITKILIEDPAHRSLFGFDHYYEIVLFAEPDAVIRLRGATDDQERVFATYPVVFCCTRLPASCPQGEEVQEAMELTGVYLKTWQYPSQFMSTLKVERGRALQPSPLLIGKSPKRRARPQPKPRVGLWVGIAFIGILLGLTVILTWVGTKDQEIAHRRRKASDQFLHDP